MSTLQGNVNSDLATQGQTDNENRLPVAFDVDYASGKHRILIALAPGMLAPTGLDPSLDYSAKFFKDDSASGLESQVNQWLDDNDSDTIVDVRYYGGTSDSNNNRACVIYGVSS